MTFLPSGAYSATAVDAYVGRLESTNIVPDIVQINVTTSGNMAGGAECILSINNVVLTPFTLTSETTYSTTTRYINTTDPAILSGILAGRISDNYDFFKLYFNKNNNETIKVYNVEILFSGARTWDNYTAGLPNVLYKYCYPNSLGFRNSSQWVNQAGTLVNGSGYYHINKSPSGVSPDTTYIRHAIPPAYSNSWTVAGATTAPNGGLSMVFDVDSLDPLSQVTRAQLTMRMSLPPSGQYDNARDTFEVNGYNYRFKEQDYKDEMTDAIGSVPSRNSQYGYFVYGAGSIVEQSGFRDYRTELSFLDPDLSNGDLASIKNRNIDIFNNMEFRIVGLPSGTLLSAAQLYLEYLPNDTLGLYTVGGVDLTRKFVPSLVDTGGTTCPLFGDGAWQHRGNLNEGTIFDAFYKFNEASPYQSRLFLCWRWNHQHSWLQTPQSLL
jgi:hypothetical protein